MTVKGIEAIRATFKRFSLLIISFLKKGKKEPKFLMILCEKTVPMARIAPSQVDIEAATIATNIHPPKKAGAS